MEISVPTLSPSPRSIFEAILEECSLRQPPHEQEPPAEPPLTPLFSAERMPMDEQVWCWLEQAHEGLQDEKESGLEDLTMEFKRVKSLREEQESKLAEFLREDERRPQPPSPRWGSVSPRKGKRIEKGRRGRGAESP